MQSLTDLLTLAIFAVMIVLLFRTPDAIFNKTLDLGSSRLFSPSPIHSNVLLPESPIILIAGRGIACSMPYFLPLVRRVSEMVRAEPRIRRFPRRQIQRPPTCSQYRQPKLETT